MNYNIISLFPVPVYTTIVSHDYNFLLQEIKKLPFREMPEGGGEISSSKQVLDIDCFKSLKNDIDKHLKNFTSNCLATVDCEFYIKSSWIIKLTKDNFSRGHIHGNSLLSGVIYLQSDSDSSLLNFTKDSKYNNLFSSSITPNYREYNQYNSDIYTGTTEQGRLYIFPSNLMHNVPPHKSNQERYSLSFDCFVKGIFGKADDAQLTIYGSD